MILEYVPIAKQLLDYVLQNPTDMPMSGHVAAAQAIK